MKKLVFSFVSFLFFHSLIFLEAQSKGAIIIASLEGDVSIINNETQTPVAAQPLTFDFWRWRNQKICYSVQGTGQPLMLIHGFGASIGHWKHNISLEDGLAEAYNWYKNNIENVRSV